MIYRCRKLVTMDGPPVVDGAVVVRGEFVEAAGTWEDVRREFPEETVEDLGEVTVTPGLVNAHCHLDYSTMRHAILPPAGFAEWVGRINALKRTLDQEDYLAAIAKGFREFARWGTTSVLNIEAFPELMWKMPAPPLRTWWFYELIDVRRVIATEELVAGALLFFQGRFKVQEPSFKEGSRAKVQGSEAEEGGGWMPEGWLGGTGLSPHAPYTASPEMYRLARDVARQTGMPWTTHLGESADERAMFVEGRGPLFDFMKGIGRPVDDCGHGRSALAQWTEAGCVGPECIAVHLNDWEAEDFALVEPGGALEGMTVVHCPQSHRYFRHAPFPWGRLQAAGVNLCVGTDSPASDGSFSLLEEVRAAAAVFPGVGAEEWLRTITRHPARALRLEGKLGCLRPGAWADLAAWPCGGTGGNFREGEPSERANGNPTRRRGEAETRGEEGGEKKRRGAEGNIYAEVVACRAPTVWRMINGRAA